MDTVGFISRPVDDTPQEVYPASPFLYRHAGIDDLPFAAVPQLRQLMVMGSKERLGVHLVPDMLNDSPGNAHAIVGAGAATDFIEDNEAASGCILKYVGYLIHLHHEGTLTAGQIVTGSDAGEDAVYRRNPGFPCRHEAACLCHEGDDRHLTHIGRLTSHVWTGDNDDFPAVMVKDRIVGDKDFPLQQPLYQRMTTIHDIYCSVIGESGTDVVIFRGRYCQRV